MDLSKNKKEKVNLKTGQLKLSIWEWKQKEWRKANTAWGNYAKRPT